MRHVEFLLGGLSTCCAGVFSNPLEVVKTRMQLQGELKASGRYTVHYRNVFHAFYTIGKHDGILALQKGLVPALWYQFFMNGVRLGSYQWLLDQGFADDGSGNKTVFRSLLCSAFSGCAGAVVGSPLYMVKTQLQSKSYASIAVGDQHDVRNMSSGLRDVWRKGGLAGLWRGSSAAVCRVTVGSAAQLTTFSTAKELIITSQIFSAQSLWNSIGASLLSGCAVVAVMTPFDVISTRLYNQSTDLSGKGRHYSNVIDCFSKVTATEGVLGLYKGWTASLFRLFPHTVLSLVFWDLSRKIYYSQTSSS